MPSIVESLYKDFVKPYYYRVFIFVLIVVFSALSYYAYTNYYLPKSKENADKLGKNVANANMRKKDAQLMFFYADWCPHCRNAKPIWQSEKDKYKDTLVNGYNMVFVDVDCSDNEDSKTQAAVQEYNIQGFPTVKMVYSKPDGTKMTVDFDAKITTNALDQFIQTVLHH